MSRQTRHLAKYLKLNYNYVALDRIKHWHDTMWARLRTEFLFTLSWDSVLFEAAEHAYQHELKALRRRIDRQYAARKVNARATPN